jgi:beta-N-acetylhexosaminidase
MGAALAGSGINLNFAPSVDLDFPDSPAIGDLGRAFHRDPQQVTAHARAFAQAMQDEGLSVALKHFPGHGSARGDTHAGYVDVSATWSEEELIPYQRLIQEGFSGMIMAAHVTLDQYGALPADLNPALITGLLRRDLGWQGVVVTDDMQMQAIAAHYSLEQGILLALRAGVDMLVFGNNTQSYDPDIAFKAYDSLLDLVSSGQISEARIAESWERIRLFKEATLERERR